ncbi:MAG: hypothetical protein EXS27_04405 [Pedosphaera sp.]|nr:hypothetical protein [Pedosphaera sp.]
MPPFSPTPRRRLFIACLALFLGATYPADIRAADTPAKPTQPPFKYLWGTAHYILAETHSDESGYFSIVEGRNGHIYVGTANYHTNAFLVDFDPATAQQKIAIDTHKLCGLSATGFAAQAKIHTRNFVGPSGTVYVGSKQGYARAGDTGVYPGGYVMTYDPRTGKAENLGMPFPAEGVIDVVADESRGLLYVVTCEKQHWMRYDTKARRYRELGPLLTSYATTLVDPAGRAHAITADFQMAQYDPATDKVTVREIQLDGAKWLRADDYAIPTWHLAADGRTAYLILMNAPHLIAVDLVPQRVGDREIIRARNLGPMLAGKGFDSRASLSIAPDGRVYTIIRVDNQSGFGGGYLHHIARFDPKTSRMEDLGVIAVKNPDFFDFGPRANGKRPPWSHGYHTLPDKTLTPLHGHQGLIVARDGTLYALILYPFTLLQIKGVN